MAKDIRIMKIELVIGRLNDRVPLLEKQYEKWEEKVNAYVGNDPDRYWGLNRHVMEEFEKAQETLQDTKLYKEALEWYLQEVEENLAKEKDEWDTRTNIFFERDF